MAEKRSAGKMEPVAKNPGIYRRNGRYIVTVWNPKKGKAGGKEWQSLPEGATLKEARELRTKMSTKVDAQRGRSRGAVKTVEEWAGYYTEDGEWVQGQWLQLMPRKAESTNMHNDSRVRAFAREFAGRTLGSINEEEAAGFALENPGSFKEVHAMMNDACAKKLLEHNPFAGITVRAREGRTNIVVLKDHELEQLCGIARAVHGPSYGPLFAAMIKTAAMTGLRPGELFLLSLEPGDQLNFADLDAGVVHVDWQLSSKTRKVGRPKNGSIREVVLLPGAEEALRSIKSWTRGLPVFLTKRGKPFNQRTHFYYWDPVRAAFVASLPEGHHLRQRQVDDEGANLDFYELRHFFGTKLAHPPAGVTPASPQDIAQMMGHKDGGELAMKVYIHTEAEDARERIRNAWRKAS